jgi:hypothetical protein
VVKRGRSTRIGAPPSPKHCFAFLTRQAEATAEVDNGIRDATRDVLAARRPNPLNRHAELASQNRGIIAQISAGQPPPSNPRTTPLPNEMGRGKRFCHVPLKLRACSDPTVWKFSVICPFCWTSRVPVDYLQFMSVGVNQTI